MDEDMFSGPVCERESTQLRRFVVISRIIQADFSALQTVWRREWDYIVRVARKGLARNPLIALRRLMGFRPILSHTSQQNWRE
jgi:hypothetical protein